MREVKREKPTAAITLQVFFSFVVWIFFGFSIFQTKQKYQQILTDAITFQPFFLSIQFHVSVVSVRQALRGQQMLRLE